MGQVGEDGGKGVLKPEADGIGINHLHPLQLGKEEGEGARQFPAYEALQVELHCLGVEGGAVVEGYTPPQAQGEGSAAIAEGVALRQVGYDAPLGSKLRQGFADVGDDGGGRGVLGQGASRVMGSVPWATTRRWPKAGAKAMKLRSKSHFFIVDPPSRVFLPRVYREGWGRARPYPSPR